MSPNIFLQKHIGLYRWWLTPSPVSRTPPKTTFLWVGLWVVTKPDRLPDVIITLHYDTFNVTVVIMYPWQDGKGLK